MTCHRPLSLHDIHVAPKHRSAHVYALCFHLVLMHVSPNTTYLTQVLSTKSPFLPKPGDAHLHATPEAALLDRQFRQVDSSHLVLLSVMWHYNVAAAGE